MVFSKAVKIALASTFGAFLVSSTLLFPLIKRLNHTITMTNSTKELVENEYTKTVQVISKDQNTMLENMNAGERMIHENPSIEMKHLQNEDASKIQYYDTAVKSNILKEDIPHHKTN